MIALHACGWSQVYSETVAWEAMEYDAEQHLKICPLLTCACGEPCITPIPAVTEIHTGRTLATQEKR